MWWLRAGLEQKPALPVALVDSRRRVDHHATLQLQPNTFNVFIK
jgi:hypothetical protein